MSVRVRAALGGFLGMLLLAPSGCTRKHSSGTVCPRAEPAFRLQVVAPGGAVPDGLRLDVAYQGSRAESFVVGQPGKNVDVCCRLGAPVTGPLPHVSCTTIDETSTSTVRSPAIADAAASFDAAVALDATVPLDASTVDAATPEAGAHDSGTTPAVDAGAPRALLCELWTNGSASIQITAPHLDTIREDLLSKVRSDGCGVLTVDEKLVLTGPDGG